jgi:DNA-binding CsgD family transcriptional regulator
LPPLTAFHFPIWAILRYFGYEALARVAFFSRDRETLEWSVSTLQLAAHNPMARRIAAVALPLPALLDGPATDRSARDHIDAALRTRDIENPSFRGGLLTRETPYLAVAAADPEWIAAERTTLQRLFENDPDDPTACMMLLLDAVKALQERHNALAEEHWQQLLTLASEGGFGLLWIDAIEGLAICAARAGAHTDAARLAGAAESARQERGYRYRYPHVAELPAGSDEGRRISLAEATAYARRGRGERAHRPTSGWAALTPTELEVAKAVAAGLTNHQVAEKLFMSVPTVKTHLRHIFDKLEVDNRAQLAALATRGE